MRIRTWTAAAVFGLGMVLQHADVSAAPQQTSRAATLPAQLQDFDAYVEGVRERFEVPGIAVAIVKDGEVVLQRGFGVRELGGETPVDAHTLFAIASLSKAFTSASLSMLADDGKLELDDRVVDHLPWFRMADPYVTREMRIRDLLVHRSGLALGAGDLLYWPTTDYSTEEVARRLKDVPLSGQFRGQYAYDNILYGVAQLVIEEASGMPYEAFLRTQIFEPLGMDDTRFNSDALRADDNVASGHARVGLTSTLVDLQPAPRMSWANVSGAGGLYSSAHDMAEWMRMQLDQGAIVPGTSGDEDAAQRLFSAERQKAMWSLVTPIPIREPSVPELAPVQPNFLGYGEGWQVSDYRGEKLVWHTGGWPGMVSRLTLVPEHELGVIVLTSAELGGAFNAITLRVLDAYLDAPRTDWTAAYAAALAKSQNESDDDWAEHVAARDKRSRPSLPCAEYVGTYRDPWYGDVVISQDDGKLAIQFTRTPQLAGTLSHWQHDTFVVRWNERWLNADAFLSFALTPDGEIREARMEAISPLTDFSFDFHDLRLVPIDKDE